VLQFLKSRSFSSVFFLIIFFILIKIPFFLWYDFDTITQQTIFENLRIFQFHSKEISFALAQLLILFQAIWLNNLFQKSDFHNSNGIIPAYIFIIISSTVSSYNFFNQYHLINLLLLLIYNIFLSIFHQESAKNQAFNLGFTFGLCTTIFPNAIVFLPFILLIFYNLKRFVLKEIILIIIGFTFVWFLVFAFIYLLEIDITNPFNFYFYKLNFIHQNNFYLILPIAISILYLGFSFISLRGIMQATSVKRKKSVGLIIYFLIGLAILIAFSSFYLIHSYTLIFVPITIFISLLMLRIRKPKIAETLNLIFALTIFIIHVIQLIY
jgi:hypothetical protein